VPHKIHQVSGIFSIMNGKIGSELNLLGVLAQEPCSNPMKRARPSERAGYDARARTEHLAADALNAANHLGCRATGKGHQQNAARIGTVNN
jgi:hypothetical protein